MPEFREKLKSYFPKYSTEDRAISKFARPQLTEEETKNEIRKGEMVSGVERAIFDTAIDVGLDPVNLALAITPFGKIKGLGTLASGTFAVLMGKEIPREWQEMVEAWENKGASPEEAMYKTTRLLLTTAFTTTAGLGAALGIKGLTAKPKIDLMAGIAGEKTQISPYGLPGVSGVPEAYKFKPEEAKVPKGYTKEGYPIEELREVEGLAGEKVKPEVEGVPEEIYRGKGKFPEGIITKPENIVIVLKKDKPNIFINPEVIKKIDYIKIDENGRPVEYQIKGGEVKTVKETENITDIIYKDVKEKVPVEVEKEQIAGEIMRLQPRKTELTEADEAFRDIAVKDLKEQRKGESYDKNIPKQSFKTPIIKGKENLANIQSSGLPEGKFYALDKPFESEAHDIKTTKQVKTPYVRNVFDPDGLLNKETMGEHKQIFSDMINYLNKEKPIDNRKAMAEFLQSKGFDSYIRGIDGDPLNRELIVFEEKPYKPPPMKSAEELLKGEPEVKTAEFTKGELTPSYLQIKKQSNGKYKAFFRGTNNSYEIGNKIFNEEFDTITDARNTIKAELVRDLQKKSEVKPAEKIIEPKYEIGKKYTNKVGTELKILEDLGKGKYRVEFLSGENKGKKPVVDYSDVELRPYETTKGKKANIRPEDNKNILEEVGNDAIEGVYSRYEESTYSPGGLIKETEDFDFGPGEYQTVVGAYGRKWEQSDAYKELYSIVNKKEFDNIIS